MTSDNEVQDKTASDETTEEESSTEGDAQSSDPAEEATSEAGDESSTDPNEASDSESSDDSQNASDPNDNDDDAQASDDDDEDEDEDASDDDDADEVDDSDDAQASDDDDEDEDEDEDASDDDDADEVDDSDDDAQASDDDDEDADEVDDEDDSDDAQASDDDDEDDSDDDDAQASDHDDEDEVDDSSEIVVAGEDGDGVVPRGAEEGEDAKPVKGMAAFFDVPDELMVAAAHTRDSEYEEFDAFSPFPIHGMDEAMGLGRSWIPWVTFGAGAAGFLTAVSLQFGTMTFDWPMIIGGKPYAPWPAFVPIMFELTVLLAGCITALVMLIAAGCFRKPFIIDREITKDRFALWISADDEAFDADEVRAFMETLDPVEIRTITESA